MIYINELYRSLGTHIQELERIASRNYVKRLVLHSHDETAINDHIQEITWSIQSLTVGDYYFVFKISHSTQRQVESLYSIEFALEVSTYSTSRTMTFNEKPEKFT